MPSIAVYGDSGMGKTMIMERFRDDNPTHFDAVTGRLRTPVLAMEMVGKPGERRFYAELLSLLEAPQSPRADIVQMEQSALRLLASIGVQVLVIDEISLVCFGVNDAREAISGDVQLARRFDEFSLYRWEANEQFENLIASILRNTPLRHPTVLTPKSLRRILQTTGGITASIFKLINGLAAEAVESGAERITDEAVANWRPLVIAEAAFA